MKFTIKLTGIEDVKRFVAVTNKFAEDIDVSPIDRRYTVDGHSILGIFSLDLRKDLTIEFLGTEERFEQFKKLVRGTDIFIG